MKLFKYTDKGPRKKNEDSAEAKQIGNTIFAAIADGVGGVAHGEVASSESVKLFFDNIEGKTKLPFSQFLEQANKHLEKIAKDQFNKEFIGTTFTGLYANKYKIKGIHIGDSRAILIREGKLNRLTDDHNLAGRILRENKGLENPSDTYGKNVLENMLGNKSRFNYQEFSISSKPGDRIIISTDGFHENISEEIIIRISNKYRSIEKVFQALITEIENSILRDNASFICIEI